MGTYVTLLSKSLVTDMTRKGLFVSVTTLVSLDMVRYDTHFKKEIANLQNTELCKTPSTQKIFTDL